MNPNESYSVTDGRVQTRSLEVHIVDHCNLRCAACCSLSPVSEKKLVEPAAMARDLQLAKLVLAPKWLKLVGGEPLLHPEILECLRVAREAELAETLSVTTNGFLLLKMKEAFWKLVDHLTISLYPKPPLPEQTIREIQELADSHGVEVNWKQQESFVQMDREEADEEGRETQKIYDDCWLRRRCHLIAYGRFYTCTRPSHLHAVSALEDSPYLHDGMLLDSGASILDHLIKKEPLASCALCLGGNGAVKSHRPLTPAEVKVEQKRLQELYQKHASVSAT